ncbi:MAG: HAMP domain-containing histidine kinase [Acidobacteria bacterium]|nr:HAMP domain-containing histidine kinase [Acidobacteriota bacterium]
MFRLRNRLLLAFLVATLVPLSISLWVTSSLLERSLAHSSTREIEQLSQALKETGREYYRQAREMLRADAEAGRARAEKFPLAQKAGWPESIAEFHEGGEKEEMSLGGDGGNLLHYMVRREDGVWRYARPLGSVRMQRIQDLYGDAYDRVEQSRGRDLRRGYFFALLSIAATALVVAVAVVVFFSYRIAAPVQRLTDALQRLAAGDPNVRVAAGGNDEIGAALDAFNHMAEQLQQSRERMVMLARLESWQALGRKMAHEVKNSLTPIRLTVEEMAARQGSGGGDAAFLEQASRIIVEEVTRLERRVRAFSDLAAEPPVYLTELDVNAVMEERTGFLRGSHPEVIYQMRLTAAHPRARGDEDLVRGILTNLLENAAEAAGPGGVVLALTRVDKDKVRLEVHDSGPGLSLHARQTLFQPTISFKRTGMGLGLSIARKSALLSGGDIEPIDGELGGAAFRVTLPLAEPAASDEPTSSPTRQPATKHEWLQNES